MPFWHRLVIAGAAVLIAGAFAKLADKALGRKQLAPEAVTRYRAVRRVVMTTIVFVLVIGFAAQRTIGNAVAGVMIAFSQPLRLGDRVEIDGVEGTVEEIGLTYTFIRAADDARLVIPNEKLASDTIRNLTIRSTERVAEITVQVPLQQDLDALLDALRAETSGDVYLSSIDGNAVITLRERAASQPEAERLARDLRLRAHRRLRAAGVYG